MSIYDDWGFSDNPFQTTSLPPSEIGLKLLVGRDEELKRLEKRLTNPPKIPTVEGLNGVGKSSLVNVAAYKSYQAFLRDQNQPMLIPCRKVFQLLPTTTLADFVDSVLREVAQTLLEEGKKLDKKQLD
jgi:hypothetical protein